MIRMPRVAILALLILLPACQSDSPQSSEKTNSSLGTKGSPTSAAAANQANHNSAQPTTTLTSTVLNGYSANKLGATVDDSDRAAAARAEQRAYTAPVGQQITWNNPQNGNAGTITPVRDGYDNSGAYCREFHQTTTIGGQQQQGYGRACQQPDGSWKIAPQP